jgi:hypothetical protein
MMEKYIILYSPRFNGSSNIYIYTRFEPPTFKFFAFLRNSVGKFAIRGSRLNPRAVVLNQRW